MAACRLQNRQLYVGFDTKTVAGGAAHCAATTYLHMTGRQQVSQRVAVVASLEKAQDIACG